METSLPHTAAYQFKVLSTRFLNWWGVVAYYLFLSWLITELKHLDTVKFIICQSRCSYTLKQKTKLKQGLIEALVCQRLQEVKQKTPDNNYLIPLTKNINTDSLMLWPSMRLSWIKLLIAFVYLSPLHNNTNEYIRFVFIDNTHTIGELETYSNSWIYYVLTFWIK